MTPIDYYTKLSEEGKAAYAERVGCSLIHMKINLFRVRGGVKKKPRDELLIRLVDGSEGHVSLDDAIDYFLVQPVIKLAEEMYQEKEPSKVTSPKPPLSNDNAQQIELVG